MNWRTRRDNTGGVEWRENEEMKGGRKRIRRIWWKQELKVSEENKMTTKIAKGQDE